MKKWLLSLALIVSGCITAAPRPPVVVTPDVPAPVVVNDSTFPQQCADIWQQELHRAIDPAGLAGCLGQFRGGASGDVVRASVRASDEWKVVHAPPPVIAPVHLEARGSDFVDAAGRPTCLSGKDQFIAFRMWLDGRHDELEALVAESHEFNWTIWRIFFQGSKAQNTIFDLSPTEPGYYENVRPFADWLNARGIGLLAEIFVDNQDVRSPYSHFDHMADLLRGSATILSGGNEAPKNGFDPQALRDPGMLWTRGSGLADEVTPQNGATAASFHQRTDYPATIMDAAASAVFMRDHGYTLLMMDEPTRFDQDGSNKSHVPDSPRFAFRLASIYRAMWNLVVFHDGAGQRGQLMAPPLREIAAQWALGLRLSSLQIPLARISPR